MKLPPYMMDADGYCYPATYALARDKTLKPWRGQITPTGHAAAGSEPPLPWQGRTVVCIGSGPSLTAEDCKRVEAAGAVTIATNDSWRRAPFADVLYALDPGWWQQHIHEITTPAERWTASVAAAQEFDLHLHITHTNILNSGARAMELAAARGAKRLILLGYDCSIDAGTHWHGDHTRTHNPDQEAVRGWHRQFADLALILAAGGVDVVNCSRRTALTCFHRGDLETELAAEITCKRSHK